MRVLVLSLLLAAATALPHHMPKTSLDEEELGPVQARTSLDEEELGHYLEWEQNYREALELEELISMEESQEEPMARHHLESPEDQEERRIGAGIGVQLPFGLGFGLSSGLGNGGLGVQANAGFKGGYTRYGTRNHYGQYYLPQQQTYHPTQYQSRTIPNMNYMPQAYMPQAFMPQVYMPQAYMPQTRAIGFNLGAGVGPLNAAVGAGTSFSPLGLGAGAGIGLGPLGVGASVGAGQGELGFKGGLGFKGNYANYGKRPYWSQYYLPRPVYY